MSKLPLAPTLRPRLTPGTGITATVDIGEDTEVTMADLMDMVTTERDLLMRPPLPNLAPTPLLKLTRGTDITVMPTGLTVMAIMVDTMAIDMVTTERDLLMSLPLLNLAPTLMPLLIRGTVTTVHTVMPTGLTDMVTTALATEAITGDKKWTSR